MLIVDAGSDGTVATDIIDAGSTATPPTDIYDSMFILTPQVSPTGGMFAPVFGAVSSNEAINPGPGQILIVRVGGTATTVTVQIPGVQPYTLLPRDNQSTGNITNAERVFHLPDMLVDSTGSIVVLYSQTVGVSSALIQVG